MTVREYITHWQEVYDRPRSRPTTYAAHGTFLRITFSPAWGIYPSLN